MNIVHIILSTCKLHVFVIRNHLGDENGLKAYSMRVLLREGYLLLSLRFRAISQSLIVKIFHRAFEKFVSLLGTSHDHSELKRSRNPGRSLTMQHLPTTP